MWFSFGLKCLLYFSVERDLRGKTEGLARVFEKTLYVFEKAEFSNYKIVSRRCENNRTKPKKEKLFSERS